MYYVFCQRREVELNGTDEKQIAEIAQLVEHHLAKVGVASSSLVFRSILCLRVSHCLCRARFSIKSHGPIAQLVRATGS